MISIMELRGNMATEKKRCTAVVLAAGSGRRMHAATAKQFMELSGKPLIWYSLHAVERSEIIDDCILVTGEADISYVWTEIVGKYGFKKVTDVIAGVSERYASVGNAMRYIAEGRQPVPNREGYVFIHDGARPFLTEEILQNTYDAVCRYGACVAAVPSKDTVKIADEQGFAVSTPDRRLVWNIQTPQVFETKLITAAYGELEQALLRLSEQGDDRRELSGCGVDGPGINGPNGDSQMPGSQGIAVTDDASVVELFTDHKVRLTFGSYENIKITTPEDIRTAEGFLELKRNTSQLCLASRKV